jgi:ATP-binding cassette subfamily B multidrug efflux pump
MFETIRKYLDLDLLWRLLRFAAPYKSLFYFTLFITITLGLIAPVRPYMIKLMVDRFIPDGDTAGLLRYTFFLVLILLGESIFQYLQIFYANLLGQNIIRDLRVKLYQRLIRFKLAYFDKTPIGTLVTRTVSDIETIAEVFSHGVINIFGEILKIFIIIGAMIFINWKLALLSLSPIPLLIFATYLFKNAVKSAYESVRTEVSALNTFVQEHLVGISIVQAFNREEREMEKFKVINARHRDAHIKSVWAYSVFFPVVELLSAVAIAILIWYGMDRVWLGKLTFGDILLYIFFIFMLFRPIRQLADQFNVLQMGMVGAQRVFNILDLKESEITNKGTINSGSLQGNIAFESVDFQYTPDNPVLQKISFKIEKGQKVALVGATGSGKTTIASLIYRFYEYTGGRILLDGKDIREYDLNFLRSHMALVQQDVFLFSDSILNNITLRDPKISEQQVIEAAKKVGVHEFIMKLPGGYNYNVKERGGVLSMGQRQLVSFIRAYVNNPGLLILDEATSSIDSETELLIQHATHQLTEGRTSLIIAHRLSTIRNADLIIVLDKGKVIEQGDHFSLMEQKGHYFNLFEMQFKGKSSKPLS